jgi:restriction system protein
MNGLGLTQTLAWEKRSGHTGAFTLEEARRDGVPPVELVDGEKPIEVFEQLEPGLIPRRTFEVNHKFFEKFRQ